MPLVSKLIRRVPNQGVHASLVGQSRYVKKTNANEAFRLRTLFTHSTWSESREALEQW